MSIDSSFSLSIDNLKQIPFEKYDNKFTFIVNGKRYETSRFIADLLSPIIREYHYSDETKTEYILKTKIDVQEQLNGDDYFTDFLKLTSFDTKNLNSNQKLYFSNYFLQLGNINEYLLLQLLSVNEEISPNNVISRLKFLTDQLTIQSIQLTNSKIKEILNQLIEYISSNFDSISKEEMKQLDSETIELIISDPSLKLSEEDTLLNFILDLYKTDTKNSFFFEYVLFNNVSETSLTKFIKIFNIEDINSRIWSSICRRILPSQSKCQNEEGRYNGNIKTFSYEKGKEFQGIMRFLSKETGGNIHDNGTIEITTKSNTSNSKYLVDYEKDNFFNSGSPKDEEIRFDFKERRIQLSSYLIQSHIKMAKVMERL